MALSKWIVAIGTVAVLAGCSGVGDHYAAEVGYLQGSETKWSIWGDFSSLDECKNAAMDEYNRYFSENRAASWACLKKNADGGYAGRYR